jgi:hypothetical protein
MLLERLVHREAKYLQLFLLFNIQVNLINKNLVILAMMICKSFVLIKNLELLSIFIYSV